MRSPARVAGLTPDSSCLPNIPNTAVPCSRTAQPSRRQARLDEQRLADSWQLLESSRHTTLASFFSCHARCTVAPAGPYKRLQRAGICHGALIKPSRPIPMAARSPHQHDSGFGSSRDGPPSGGSNFGECPNRYIDPAPLSVPPSLSCCHLITPPPPSAPMHLCCPHLDLLPR